MVNCSYKAKTGLKHRIQKVKFPVVLPITMSCAQLDAAFSIRPLAHFQVLREEQINRPSLNNGDIVGQRERARKMKNERLSYRQQLIVSCRWIISEPVSQPLLARGWGCGTCPCCFHATAPGGVGQAWQPKRQMC